MRESALLIVMMIGALCRADSTDTAVAPHRMLLGGDLSGLSRIEEYGGVFYEDGQPSDLIHSVRRCGWNCIRLRLFVNPNQKNLVVNDLDYTLSLAKRVKEAGHELLLDLHYSDTWADPQKQNKPKGWEDLDVVELKKEVRSYTRSVITEFEEHGVLPDVVQIGNEVIDGMLWPEGRLSSRSNDSSGGNSWERFASLLKAGIRGVSDAVAGAPLPRIMIHIDRGGDWPATKYFYDQLAQHGVEYDLIGLSYYPWWHGNLDALKLNLFNTAERFGKPIVVVEAGYPHRFREKWRGHPDMQWPMSPEGQEQFVSDLIRLVRELPNDLGRGVIYWYPEALPVKGLDIWEDGAVALFDREGRPLPAIDAFGNAFNQVRNTHQSR